VKLHWSPRSPFVRKVMITAHECLLVEDIELIRARVAMVAPNRELMTSNPLSKIPTLVLDDGRALFDSTVICEYLDQLAQQRGIERDLFPREAPARFDALCRNALAGGLTDLLILWRHERERPLHAQSSALLAAFAEKVDATLARLEAAVSASPAARFDIGDIALGCALSYLDFRFASLDWRADRALLALWHDRFTSRPSVRATAIVDGSVMHA
jgi:glutathione S-transferase